jgi:hypothetical protein
VFTVQNWTMDVVLRSRTKITFWFHSCIPPSPPKSFHSCIFFLSRISTCYHHKRTCSVSQHMIGRAQFSLACTTVVNEERIIHESCPHARPAKDGIIDTSTRNTYTRLCLLRGQWPDQSSTAAVYRILSPPRFCYSHYLIMIVSYVASCILSI